MEALKRMAPDIQTYARENAKGTPMLPRDALTAALFGRGPVIYLDSGEVYRSMPNRINISELLDNITARPGSLMFRGKNLWLPVPPGQAGQVLTYRSATETPIWGAGGGGASQQAIQVFRSTDSPAVNSWPKFCEFDAVMYDDGGFWNPTEPDRLFVPNGATRVRLHAFALLSPRATALENLFSIVDADDNGEYPGSGMQTQAKTAGRFQTNAASLQTAWLPAGISPYYRLRANQSAGFSAGFLTGSSLTMEVQF